LGKLSPTESQPRRFYPFTLGLARGFRLPGLDSPSLNHSSNADAAVGDRLLELPGAVGCGFEQILQIQTHQRQRGRRAFTHGQM